MLQRNIILKYSPGVLEWVFQTRIWLFLLVALQLLWFLVMAWTRATTNVDKLIFLTILTIINGVLVSLLPDKFISRLRNLISWLLEKEKRLFLALILIAFIVGTIYAYSQRVWVDEESSFLAAKIIANQGVEGVATSYRNVPWLRDQHPPLVILVYGLILHVFGANLFFARLFSVLFFTATLLTTYLLGRELYNQEIGFFAVFFFLSFPLVTRLGSAAMMDIQLTFFFSLAILLTLHLRKRPSSWLSLVIGIIIGLGLLTKYIMFLIFPVLLSFAIVSPTFRKIKYHLLGAALVSVCLFAIWLIYAFQIGILSGQIQRIVDYSGINYLINDIEPILSQENTGSQPPSPEDNSEIIQTRIYQLGVESLLTRIPSSIGIYHIPMLLIAGILLLRNREQPGLILVIWIAIVFVILFLTLPDHRYLLMTFPAIAIVIARLFYQYPQNSERVIILSLLSWIGALYLFVDWHREILLFLPNP